LSANPPTCTAATGEPRRRMAWSAAIPIDPGVQVARGLRAFARECGRVRFASKLAPTKLPPSASALAFAFAFVSLPEKHPHAPSAPFRRPKVIGVSGGERHGCRGSRDWPWMALRGGPLKLRGTEGTFREAKSRMSGARPFGSFWGVCQKGLARGGETQSPRAHRSDAGNQGARQTHRGRSPLLRKTSAAKGRAER